MIKFTKEEMEVAATSEWKATLQHLVNKVQSQELWDIDGTEIIFEDEYDNTVETELKLENIVLAPAQMEDRQPETHDPLKERGVEVEKNKAKDIMSAMPPKNKKELQRFLGQTDLVKYMLHRPILTGRFGKWLLALAEFTLIYCPQKVMKGQVVAHFLADHPMVDVAGSTPVDIPVFCVNQSWTLKFDGSSTEKASGVGVVITFPTGIKTIFSFNLDFSCTNNQAEYEALVIGLEILRDLGARDVLIIGDSQLALKQMSGEYKYSSLALAPYFTQLLDDFEDVTFQHVPRQDNWEANELAQIASGLRMSPEPTHKILLVQKRNNPSIYQRGIQVDTFDIDVEFVGGWKEEIKDALRNPEQMLHYGLKMRILHYVLMEDELYRKGDDGLLLRCLGFPEAMRIM
ncbi:uncharacterized protein [Primulina eburnea]|uniref:uncharacterized protein n=1 Tax=Primulina eburnea TaxID=1245227 RepID=UPI003C6C88E8